MPIRDPVLIKLVQRQTELFNKDGTEMERIEVLGRIQEHQQKRKAAGSS